MHLNLLGKVTLIGLGAYAVTRILQTQEQRELPVPNVPPQPQLPESQIVLIATLLSPAFKLWKGDVGWSVMRPTLTSQRDFVLSSLLSFEGLQNAEEWEQRYQAHWPLPHRTWTATHFLNAFSERHATYDLVPA